MSVNYFLHSEEQNLIIKGEVLKENTISYSTNRNIKDTVFRLLMDDEKNLLELFNALEDTRYTETDMIQINTLKGPIFGKKRNDLSFSVEKWFLSLIEHQSSVTENAPLRMCLYLSRVWEQVLDVSETYRRKLYKIPLPRLYLLYNGAEDFPQEKIYRLSDTFRISKEGAKMELEVRAININLDKDHPILSKCGVLKEYSIFIDKIRSGLAQGKNRDIAVKEAIRECLEQGILKEFLERHGREVQNMMFDEITYEDILRIRVAEAEEDAIERGRKQGREQGIAGLIAGFVEEGIPRNRILENLRNCFDLSQEAAQQYYEKYAN
ncbi:hypothetical protein LI177_03915 [bacterium 210820-DFI.6.37]|nr:hypothetical protein [bacterium 210820-DFI.6.37]